MSSLHKIALMAGMEIYGVGFEPGDQVKKCNVTLNRILLAHRRMAPDELIALLIYLKRFSPTAMYVSQVYPS